MNNNWLVSNIRMAKQLRVPIFAYHIITDLQYCGHRRQRRE